MDADQNFIKPNGLLWDGEDNPPNSAQTSYVIKTKEYTLTGDDLVNIWGQALVRWKDFYFMFLFFASVPLFMAWIIKLNGGACSIPLILAAVGIMVLGRVYAEFRAWMIKRKADRKAERGQVVRVHHEIDQTMITTYGSDEASSAFKISDLAIAVPYEPFFYLYFAPKKFVAIPLRAFQSGDDVKLLRDRLNANGVRIGLNIPKTRID